LALAQELPDLVSDLVSDVSDASDISDASDARDVSPEYPASDPPASEEELRGGQCSAEEPESAPAAPAAELTLQESQHLQQLPHAHAPKVAAAATPGAFLPAPEPPHFVAEVPQTLQSFSRRLVYFVRSVLNEIYSAVRMTFTLTLTLTFTPKVPLPHGLLEALDDSGILADIAAAFGAAVELQVRA
jgi:hypothetical protein